MCSWFCVTCGVYCVLCTCICLFVVFVCFFKQKTAYEMRISDWSSDVCSSDLDRAGSALADGLAAVQLDAELVGDHLLAARLLAGLAAQVIAVRRLVLLEFLEGQRDLLARGGDRAVDRKSTRLNSSH